MNPRVGGIGFVVCLSLSLSSGSLAAQRGRTSPSGGILLSTGRLVVSVKEPNGSSFPYMANVSLLTRGGGLFSSSSTQRGDQAVFENVPSGNYTVEVDAPGYKKAVQPVTMTGSGTNIVFITMDRDLPAGASPGPPILAPKALRETQKGLRALQQNNLPEAKTHLDRALQLAPGSPGVNYLAGLLYLQLGDGPQSIALLEKATSLDPKHAPALVVLGEAYYRQKEYSKAVEALEQALRLKPLLWRAHWIAGAVYLQQTNFQKAREHAEAALRIGKEGAKEARYLLAKSFAGLGECEHAITELETFLADAPSGPKVDMARQLLDRLRSPLVGLSSPLPAGEVIAPQSALAPVSTPSFLNWAPPDIDEAKLETSPGASCELPHLLEQAGARVTELVSNIEKFAATEMLEHERVNLIGIPIERESRRYEYVASIEETRPGSLFIDEHRSGAYGRDLFPAQISTRGLPVLALVFHPYHRGEFEFTCEGLSEWQGTPVWIVHFRQRADRERRMRDYRINQQSHPVSLKGRAWIAASTFQILRIESDLVEPVPEIRLFRDHLAVDYAPVRFQKQNTELWLPQFAEWYVDFAGKKYHRRHQFTNFLLFSVDEKQRINQPREVASGALEGHGKN
jgi:tetratricopeptide (TPR) repeat protein